MLKISEELYFAILAVHFIMTCICALRYRPLKKCIKSRRNVVFICMIVALGILVAVRPITVVSDAGAYFNRYYIEPERTSVYEILQADSFYRGTGYSMSKTVNLLFYFSYKAGLPYALFVFLVAETELYIYFHYIRKICEEVQIKYNPFLILAVLLPFYSYRFQFVAFAQGIGMCLLAPILYYLIRKRYFMAVLNILLAMSVHIALSYIVVIIGIYVLTPRMKGRPYAMIWCLVGLLYFTQLGHMIGLKLNGLADFVINRAIADTPIYDIKENTRKWTVSMTGTAEWLLYGLIVFSYDKKKEYWKLYNAGILSMLIMVLFFRWEFITRITNVYSIFTPLLVLLYVTESKPVFSYNHMYLKKEKICVFLLAFFVSGIRLMGFL